jgi:hypothetical protein
MCFTFESADSGLQNVQHDCKEMYQEPSVDSIGDAKTCLIFFCEASIAPPSAIWPPFKEYNRSMEMLFCFEKSARLPKGLQNLQYRVSNLCNMFFQKIKHETKVII